MQIPGGARGMVMDEIDTCINLDQRNEEEKQYLYESIINNSIIITLSISINRKQSIIITYSS